MIKNLKLFFFGSARQKHHFRTLESPALIVFNPRVQHMPFPSKLIYSATVTCSQFSINKSIFVYVFYVVMSVGEKWTLMYRFGELKSKLKEKKCTLGLTTINAVVCKVCIQCFRWALQVFFFLKKSQNKKQFKLFHHFWQTLKTRIQSCLLAICGYEGFPSAPPSHAYRINVQSICLLN